MTSAAELLGLQEIDLTRDSRRAQIADIESRLGETEELLASREAMREAADELASLQRTQREVESNLQDIEAKIRTFEDRLYGGTVKNPKELTDLQKEVEMLKQQRRRLDDRGLANMEAIEAATAALHRARAELSRVEDAWRAEQASLLQAKEQAEREAAALDAERERRTQRMEQRHLVLYESLRPKKAGRPVARIERQTCQGCRVQLPTHIVQKTRASLSLVQCPSCERILVA